MANYTFTFPGNTALPVGLRVPRYTVADTDAGKPSTGVEEGDLCYCIDTNKIYVATAQNSWTELAGGGGTPSDTVAAETAYGGAAAAGSATDYSRGDHTHGTPALGTTSATACAGDDTRLSNARTPTAHAASHKSGGSDAVKLDELAAPTDVATLNASTTAHGLLPKLSNVATEFLNGQGAFATPAGTGAAFPVGSVFLSVVSTNPATLLGYGTWSAIAAGRMLVGLDAGDPDFDVVEETGGAKTHTLTAAEMPAHVHAEQAPSSASSGAMKFALDTNASGTQAAGLDTASAGGGGAHSILNPYFVVYCWKRTA